MRSSLELWFFDFRSLTSTSSFSMLKVGNITKVGRSASLIVITSYTTSGRLGQKEINNACVVQEIGRVAPLKSLYFHWTAICSSSIVFTPRSLFLLFVLLFSGLIVEDLTTAATSPQEIMNDHLHHETIIIVPATSQNKRLGLTVMAKKGTHSNISIALTKFLAFSLVHRTSVITK